MKKTKLISSVLLSIITVIAVFIGARLGNVTGIWQIFIFMCVIIQGIICILVANMYEESYDSLESQYQGALNEINNKSNSIMKLNENMDKLLYSKNNNSFYKVVAYFNGINNCVGNKNIFYDAEILINCIKQEFSWSNIIISSNYRININQSIKDVEACNYKQKSKVSILQNNRYFYEFDKNDVSKLSSQSKCLFKIEFQSTGIYDINLDIIYNASSNISEKLEYTIEIR